MDNQSLWPEDLFDSELPTAPVDLLTQQGKELERLSKGALKGKIEPVSNGNFVNYVFLVQVPSLGNYGVEFLSVRHEVNTFWPSTLQSPFLDENGRWAHDDDIQAHSEEDLAKYIRAVFTSLSARNTILTLRAQANNTALLHKQKPRYEPNPSPLDPDVPF